VNSELNQKNTLAVHLKCTWSTLEAHLKYASTFNLQTNMLGQFWSQLWNIYYNRIHIDLKLEATRKEKKIHKSMSTIIIKLTVYVTFNLVSKLFTFYRIKWFEMINANNNLIEIFIHTRFCLHSLYFFFCCHEKNRNCFGFVLLRNLNCSQ
jgi:hypothetical protein